MDMMTATNTPELLSHLNKADLAQKNFLESLPQVKPESLPQSRRKCAICSSLLALRPNQFERAPPSGLRETAVRLPCGHVAGLDCLSKWVAEPNLARGHLGRSDSPCCRRVMFSRSPPTSILWAETRHTLDAQSTRARARGNYPEGATLRILDLMDARFDQSKYGIAVLAEEEDMLKLGEHIEAYENQTIEDARMVNALRIRRDAREAQLLREFGRLGL